MKLIVFTRPACFAGEAEAIDRLFRQGVDVLHLRKPGVPGAEVLQLLEEIPTEWHGRIMLHDFDFGNRFALKGLHLNHRRPLPPAGFHGCLSAACHSLDEVALQKPKVDYVFLSPIFDSISKQGYSSGFTPEVLQQACAEGLIDAQVMALGGVSMERIPQLAAWGFGGVALLGDIWNRLGDSNAFADYLTALKDFTEKFSDRI
jgi:thiamine-phosphate pyrophosphorylase